jgi:hypothetical protein
MMPPINRLQKIEDLCEIIAKELAFHYDGVENNSSDFREEGMVIANCVRSCIEGLLANRPTSTLRQDLERIFDLQPKSVFNNHDYQQTIRSKVSGRIPGGGRAIRRRSSASDPVRVRAISDSSLQVGSR